MSTFKNLTPKIAVVGGGVSGLAAALRCNELQPEWRVTLLEAQDRLGGVLRTERDQGYLVEHAADNFLRGPTAPWAEQLCHRIGFADELLPTAEANRGAHVVWRDKLHRVPAGFQLLAPARLWPILTSPLLSIPGRLRLCAEPLIKEPPGERDESLTEFATRRLGREAFERLVQPLVSGIYTADPDQLSIAAALPQMVTMVQEHGSLYRAMRARVRAQSGEARSRGARYSLFVAPRDGMSDFVQAIAGKLTATEIRCSSPVTQLARDTQGRWQISVAGRNEPETFDGLILALPNHHAAELLRGSATELSAELQAIPLASSAVVCLGVQGSQIGRRLDAFGCVVPAAAGRNVLAVSYTSLKFPGRAPQGEVLLRVFVGGALQPELAELPDDRLSELVRRELAILLEFQGTPRLQRIVRWPRAMPQYHLGHLDRVRRIESLVQQTPGLELAGNALYGVGIPQCVQTAERAAESLCARAAEHFGKKQSNHGESPVETRKETQR